MSEIRMICPRCLDAGRGQSELVERANLDDGSAFLGCSRYPACRETQDLPEWLKMARAGAPMLPGMED